MTFLAATLLAAPLLDAQRGRGFSRDADEESARQATRESAAQQASANEAAAAAEKPDPRSAQAQNPEFDQIARAQWSDETFVKKFLGSYAIRSQTEPKVDQEDVETFKDIEPLIASEPSAAIARLEESITGESSANLNFILANLYFQQGKREQAVSQYRAAIQKFPDFLRAHKNLGLLHLQEGNVAEALKSLNTALNLGAQDGRIFGLIGFCQLRQENYIAAEPAYRRAIMMEPQVKDWKTGLARCLLAQERYQEASSLFRQLVKEEPDNKDYWLFLANTALGQDKPMEAARYLEVVRHMGTADANSLVLLGDIYLNEELSELALQSYQAALAKDQKPSARTVVRATELLSQYGAIGEAEELLAQVRRNYGELSQDQELTLLSVDARIARERSNREEAAEILQKIVKRDPLNGQALLQLATYYEDKAKEAKEKAVAAEEKDKEEELREQANDFYAKAAMQYERATGIDDIARQAYNRWAQMLVRQQDFKAAAQKLRASLQIKEDERVEEYLSRVERAARTQEQRGA